MSNNTHTCRHTRGIIVMGLLSAILAACTGASQQWTRQKQTAHQLDAIASLSLPQQFVARPNETDSTPDYNNYYFRRTNKSHLNGQTSYAEEMTVTIASPDLPADRFDRLLQKGDIRGFGKNPGLGESDSEGRRWLVREIMYDRDPVHEPSWQIRVDDTKRKVVVTWRGFKKLYSTDDAKRNLVALIDGLTISPNVLADFATRRSWSPNGWESAYAANTRTAATVLAEFKLTLPNVDAMTRDDKWRIYLDDLRPQQLHIVYELKSIKLPDAPFRITEPLTYFKYMQQRWVQDNQGQPSDRLPPVGQELMAPDFLDQGQVYFYQMTGVDMWRTYPSDKEFADSLRTIIKTMLSNHPKLLRAGFIDGDAEP